MNFEKELNEQQIEAVKSNFQNIRVVAGAGSGKTRVLTYRIAHLISEEKVSPWKILAITFTNKVANEMLTRIKQLIPEVNDAVMVKTFHSFAAYFLRKEISNINFPTNFSILDEEDQTKLVKDLSSSLGYKKSDPIIKKTLSYIGSNKLKGLYPEDITVIKERFEDEKVCLQIYELYEEAKERMYALDFDDLLLKTNLILEKFPEVRMRWQQRLDYILIDEFQDTNDVEYKLIKLLVRPDTSLYVVGDPDQTIYTWRGANQNIILNLEKDFRNVQTIILNRNYRSTQNILDSANKLISNNKLRVKKDLYTQNTKGEPIIVNCSPSGKSEADYIAREIKKLLEVDHYRYKDIAILYRSNYITMEFETSFTALGIPYRIFGATKFYERREIKDVLSYFRLIVNERDDISFERIINVPKRGIGETSINTIKKEAMEHDMYLYQYICSEEADDSDARKAIMTLRNTITQLNKTRNDINKDEEVFSKILEDLITQIGYFDYLIKEEDGEERIENVRALFADLRYFLKSHPDSTFDEYLQNIALYSSQDELVDGDYVSMMTVHTAKGLEFPIVFVVRFNAGVFPNYRAQQEDGYRGLEEERRLAYVAMTRAKRKLYLSYATGYSFVVSSELTISPFILESGNVPMQNYYQFENHSTSKTKTKNYTDLFNDVFSKQEPIKQDFSQVTNDVDDWQVGDIVIHEKLGKGKVIELEGDGIIKVNFEEHGVKSMLGNHRMISKGGHEA